MRQNDMKQKDNIWGLSLDIAIFHREVIVLITNSKEYLMEELESVLSEDLGMDSKYAKDFAVTLKDSLNEEKPFPLGLTYELESIDNGKETFVILNGTPKTLSKDVVIHEMYHAMRKICNDRCVDDEETEAYMLEYLCHETFKQIDDFNKIPKKG